MAFVIYRGLKLCLASFSANLSYLNLCYSTVTGKDILKVKQRYGGYVLVGLVSGLEGIVDVEWKCVKGRHRRSGGRSGACVGLTDRANFIP